MIVHFVSMCNAYNRTEVFLKYVYNVAQAHTMFEEKKMTSLEVPTNQQQKRNGIHIHSLNVHTIYRKYAH